MSIQNTRSSVVRIALLASAGMVAALAPVAAQAAEPAAPETRGLEEITVTARKRAENLQTTPISISAFTSDRLESQGITSLQNIQDFTPNLTYANIPSNSGVTSNAAIFIRGIGQVDFAPTVEPGVGIYIDGVYLGRSVGGVFDLIDVDRVEVLRGPQGTLFGRNTIGGALNVTTMMPSNELKGKADVKYGTDNRINVRGYVNVPLSDNLFFKVSGGIFSQDGYVNAPFQGTNGRKLGNQDTKMVRAGLRWEPSPTFSLTLSGDYMKDKSNGAPTVATGPATITPGSFIELNNLIASGMGNPNDCLGPVGATIATCYGPHYFSKDTNYSTRDNFSRIEVYGGSITAEVALTDNLDLKSITAYREVQGLFGQDRDGTPAPISYVYDTFKQKQFSQELQLVGKAFDDRLNWVTGLYYFKEKGENINPIDFIVVQAQSGGYFDYKSWAAFTQATFKITEKLSLTGGLRYTDDRKDYSPDQFIISTLAPFLVIPPGTRIVPLGTVENDVKKWTPMINLSYQWNDGLMTYATFSQGFKGGGFTQRIFPPEASLPSFKPEEVNAYEAGFKFTGLDRRLRLNVSAFFTDYKSLQLLVADATRIGPFYTNAGTAEIKGLEAELNLVPADGWLINGSVGLTDAQYKKLAINVQGLTKDSKFIYVSKWTLSGSVSKKILLEEIGSLTPRVDWSYRSGFFTNANGINTPELYQPGYHLVNASIRWADSVDKYAVQFGVDNVFDKNYRIFGDYQPGFGHQNEAFARGRQWYMMASVNF